MLEMTPFHLFFFTSICTALITMTLIIVFAKVSEWKEKIQNRTLLSEKELENAIEEQKRKDEIKRIQNAFYDAVTYRPWYLSGRNNWSHFVIESPLSRIDVIRAISETTKCLKEQLIKSNYRIRVVMNDSSREALENPHLYRFSCLTEYLYKEDCEVI